MDMATTKPARRPRLPARLRVDDEIELRAFRPSDAPRLFAVVDANRDHLRPWMGWVDGTRSPKDLRRFISQSVSRRRQGIGLPMGIWYRGALVGTAGFNEIDWRDRKTEIGYWLASDLQGRGIVTRACQALIGLGFGRLGLNRIEIRAAPGNRRSRGIPNRLGFSQEGVLRESERVNDGYHSSVVYGLLRGDPAARRSRPRRRVHKPKARSRRGRN